MLTSSHIIIGAVVTSRPHFKPWQLMLAWVGGFMPDLPIFLMVAYSRLVNGPGYNLWRKPDGLYWQEPWQTFGSVANSFPLWALVVILALVLFKYSSRFKIFGLGLLIFSVGYFLHISVDFVTHADDAYPQFWPITDWRFFSPISYWQPEYYGRIVGVIEAIMGLAIVTYLVIKFKQWPIRIAAVLMALPYGVSLFLHF